MAPRLAAIGAAILIMSLPCLASAQREMWPRQFYVLSRTAAPRLDPANLPAAARPVYQRTLDLDRMMRAQSRGPRDEPRITFLEDEDNRAWTELEAVLRRHGDRLTPTGWFLYGLVRYRAASLAYADAAMANNTARVTDLPDHSGAARIFRHVAAHGQREIPTWARYYEAICLEEQGEAGSAPDAYRIIAAGPVAQLRGEAMFRLGERAFDDDIFDEALGWYSAAVQLGFEPHLAHYKRVWALLKLGRFVEAHTAIGVHPAESTADMITELREALAVMDPSP